jgi:TusE/DsrC/DsvC family sulfur relay protein
MLNPDAGYVFNDKGYLNNFDAWDKEFAVELASENDIELTECHWHVINFMRDYWAEYSIAPDPRDIVKKLSAQINPHGPCTRTHLEGLFGEGGCELACKIAGLQNCHCRSA